MSARTLGALATVAIAGALGLPGFADAARLVPNGELTASGTGEQLDSAATAGGYAFAGAPDATFNEEEQGAVFVFAAPAGAPAGSEHEVATLTASVPGSGASLGHAVAASGQTVVADEGQDGTALYVFTEPTAGWAGELHESAVLSATDRSVLGAPVIDGNLILAPGTDPGTGQGALFVFAEPAGGWNGVIRQSAMLEASDGTKGDQLGWSLAAAGNTIVAGAPDAKVAGNFPGAVYVFTEPPEGWAGLVHETAKLTSTQAEQSFGSGPLPFAPGFGWSVAISGGTIVAADQPGPEVAPAVDVFTQAPGGWRSESENATLSAPGDRLLQPLPTGTNNIAVSDGTVVVCGDEGTRVQSPADAAFVFTEPSGGWSGTVAESATLTTSDDGALTNPIIDGQTIVAGVIAGSSANTVVATSSAYVYVEPQSGWAGTANQTTELQVPTIQPGQPGQAETYAFSEPAGGWQSGAQPTTLAPSGLAAEVPLASDSALGGALLASGGSDDYVFTEPQGGWAGESQAATLTDPAGLGGSPASDGDTAVDSTGLVKTAGGYVNQLDVFAEPPGGWSGVLQPDATLSASDGAVFDGVGISGSTIAAVGVLVGGRTALYVFTEPPGGWSGELHEAARIPVLNKLYGGRVSVQGRVIAVGGLISGRQVVANDPAELFAEPASGWSDTPSKTTFSLPDGLLGGPPYVFTEPRGGWRPGETPSAELQNGAPRQLVAGFSIAGAEIAITTFAPVTSPDGSCPCAGTLQVFSEPRHGWSGTLGPAALAALSTNGATSVVLSGGSIVTRGPNTLSYALGSPLTVWRTVGSLVDERIGPPTVSHISLTKLAHRRLRLRFTLFAGHGGLALSSFELRLPRGLAWGGQTINGARLLSATNKRGTLVVELRRPSRRLTVVVSLHRRRGSGGRPSIPLVVALTDGTTRRFVLS